MRVPSQFDPPLTINGNKYLLGGTTSTLEPQTVMTGEPTEIPFTVYSTNDIERFSLYLNLQELDTDYSGSDTYVTYTNGNDTVRVTDPHGYISNATVTVTEPNMQRHPEKKIVHITLEFGKPMGPTNMVAYL